MSQILDDMVTAAKAATEAAAKLTKVKMRVHPHSWSLLQLRLAQWGVKNVEPSDQTRFPFMNPMPGGVAITQSVEVKIGYLEISTAKPGSDPKDVLVKI